MNNVRVYGIHKGDIFSLKTELIFIQDKQILFWLINNCNVIRQYKTPYIYSFKLFGQYRHIKSIFRKINLTEFEVMEENNGKTSSKM